MINRNIMEKPECIFISMVRDFIMYNKCITNNEYCKNFLHICIDNNKENLGIPTRYNQFLDNYDYEKPAWFIFCHED